MISILASGTLIGAAQQRTSRNGNQFVTGQMKAADGDDTSLVSLVAFDEEVCKSLLALSRGDAVVVGGSAKKTSWTGRDGQPALGLNVVVKVILTQYALTKRRKASAEVSYGLPAVSPLLDRGELDEDDTGPF